MSLLRLSSAEVQAKATKNKIRRDLDQVSSGVSYKSFGGKREGMGSMLDTEIVKHNLEMRKRNYGDGAVMFKMFKKDPTTGKVYEVNDDSAVMNIGGRAFRPNSDGLFRILDKDRMDALEAEAQQRREYVNQITRYCISSDERCEEVLGVDVESLLPGKSRGVFGKHVLSEELDQYDASPSFLDTLDGGSSFYAGGLAKLKKIVASQMPILDNFTPSNVEKVGMD